MKTLLKAVALLTLLCIATLGLAPVATATSLMENLDRGMVAVRASSTEAFVSWRLLGTDPSAVGFNLYRSTGGAAAVRLNPDPLTEATSYTDATADLSQATAYYVCPVVGGIEQAPSETYTLVAAAPVQQYLRIPLQIPAGVTTPDGVTCTYSANDCSVGDLDGDGEYEIVVKWDPSNSQDNSKGGYTGNVYLDAYKLDGTRLWRIDLGVNIRAGAHYTQFMVYDLDGDGKAEVACRTAEGSKGADGSYVAAPATFTGTLPATLDHTADRRNTGGYILGGAEFLTLFNGQTGVEITSTNYNPPRFPGTLFPTTAQINSLWGDDYGNRIDRFLSCVAYLDGRRPSLVMCRGYYTRAALVAYDYRDGKLTQRWIFDTNPEGAAATTWAAYRGQGNHNLSVADVDGDGRDEIVYGSCTIDDDGRGLYSTLLGHGDALHVTDLDPARPGLEVWVCHEDFAGNGGIGHSFRDARTGAILFTKPTTSDAGRCMTADIDPAHPGYEMWGARSAVVTVSGTEISATKPAQNFGVWWDGDLSRELLDDTTITKWDPATSTAVPVLSPSGILSNNSTKATPNLSADILGDWREEVLWRETDSSALRLYTTTAPTTTRLCTLMHDRQYRESIAWQNVGYNQPPYPSFFLGNGMVAPAQPDIVTSLAALPVVAPSVVSINRYDPTTAATGATSMTFRVSFNTAVTGVDTTDFALAATGTVAGTISGVTAQSATTYDVLISSISGIGTLRLDLNATGTGIAGEADSVAIDGGFTSGETYTRVVLAWLSTAPTSGGLWSGAANWDGGAIPDGVGSVPTFGNYDVTAPTAIALDSSRTLSGLTFGDTDTSTAAGWTIGNNGSDANILTLDVASGSPSLSVGALGTGAVVTLDTVLAGTDGLAKAGAGVAVLTKPNTLTGALNVAGGTLRIGTGGTLTPGTVALASGSTLNVAGGTLTTSGLVTAAAGTLSVDSGTVNFNAGYRTNSTSSTTLRINGGTINATDINMRRTSAATVDFTTGFIAAGGTTNVATIWIGNDNSNAAMSVEGGTVTATGAITLGNNGSNSARGGGLRVNSGSLACTDAAYGLVLTRANNNATVANFNGGVATVEKITFGYNSAVVAGSGTLTQTGGELYLGSGGMVQNGITAYTAVVNLQGGTLGAKAAWSTALPMTLANTTTLKAADASGAPFDIALGGALGGAGGIAKTGTGVLTLSAANTFTGSTSVDAGTLAVTGSLAPAGSVAVNSGGTLAGTGSVGALVLASGGTVSPGVGGTGTLAASSLVFDGGGRLALDAGATGSADALALAGAFTKGAAGTCELALAPTADFAVGNTYTLVTYASTTFASGDFTVTGLPAGLGASVTVGATGLQLTVVDTAAPSVPTGLAGSAPSPSAIALSWTASTDAIGVTGYRIYRGGAAIGTSATTTYADTGLTAATSYSYAVTAYDAAGNESAASDTANVMTQYTGAQTLAVATAAELQAALATAAANPSATYTLTLAAGTYSPTAGLELAASDLTLRSNGTVVLDGTGLAGAALLHVTGDRVILHDLTFQHAPGGAVVLADGAADGSVADCTFHGTGIAGSGSSGWLITGNDFSDLVGASATAAAAITLGADADRPTITDNVVVGCDRGIALSALSDAIVRNNFIADSRSGGHPGAAISLSGVTGAQVDNNSLYAAGAYANAIEYSGGTATGSIRNNLSNKPVAAGDTATATLATNIATAQAGWFKDPAAGDLHLAATRSGVVDAGTAISGFTVDIDGETRPTGSAYDIGADEFQPDTVAPSVPTGLSATVNSATTVTLSWTASNDTASAGVIVSGVAGYRIYRDGTAVGTSTTTSYADATLAAGTSYSYTVAAYDGAGNQSAASAAVTATTPAAPKGGGGGGAPSLWYVSALAFIGALRLLACRRR